MKKLILLSLIVITTKANAQIYMGTVITTKNANVSAGYLTASNLEVSIAYALPLRKPVYGRITSLNAGYKISLGTYSVTPSIGVASYTAKDFSEWDKGGYPIDIKKILPKYGIEVGKDAGLGRVVLSGYYCNQFFIGIGIRGFIR